MTEILTSSEQLAAPLSFVELAETVIHNPSEEVIDEALEDWRENPGEHIKNQLDELALLYRARADRETYYWSNCIEENYTFATRDVNEQEIEEVYHIFDKFSALTKQWQSRNYAVTMYRPEERITLVVRPDMRVDGYRRDVRGESSMLSDDDKDDAIVDFFSRSLIATVRSCRRDDEHRAVADADAKLKLEYMLYDGPKVVTAME